MKRLFIVFLLLFSSLAAKAQEKDEHRERIKALKTAHITEGLKLSPKEAQQFWPIYNSFHEKRRELFRREHADIENLECMNEDEATNKLNEYVEIEREDFLLKKQYYKDLGEIFSSKRIMELKKLEDEFNRKLMREYRARRKESNK